MPISEMFLTDCVPFMKTLPDGAFDLAIVDPPYGIGESAKKAASRGKLATPREWGGQNTDWDKCPPPLEYFEQLFRVSKNQIIFGGNYFMDKIARASSCWIVWDKDNGESDFADAELAWTSFETAVRIAKYKWQGMLQQDMKFKQDRIHPTEKPFALYRWILSNYAKPGCKIFDSHAGSQSLRVEAFKMGFDFTGCEIDPGYFEKGCKRFEAMKTTQTLF